MQLLAISGSLRARSLNGALLGAAALLAPPGVEVVLYDGVRALPHFDPDLDVDGGPPPPPEVRALRAAVGRADALLVSSPEYAHGVPGSLKNALDWLVASAEFPGKPVALVSASARAVHAQAQLVEILTTMSARLVAEASVVVPLAGRPLDAAAIAADPELGPLLRGAVAALAGAAAAPPDR